MSTGNHFGIYWLQNGLKFSGNFSHVTCDSTAWFTGKPVIELLKIYLQRAHQTSDFIETAKKFQCRKVRQEDTMSPELFTVYLEETLKTLSTTNKEFQGGTACLTNLWYTGDIVLFSGASGELKNMIESLSRESSQEGLKINEKSRVQQLYANWANGHPKRSRRKSKWLYLLGSTDTDKLEVKKTFKTGLECF